MSEKLLKLYNEARKRGRKPAGMQAYIVTTRESENPLMSNNGGDYDFGYTLLVETATGKVIGGRHWTSAEFDYCPGCGSFRRDCDCETFYSHWDKYDGSGKEREWQTATNDFGTIGWGTFLPLDYFSLE